MLNKLKTFLNKQFVRNVAIVATGTAAAQAIAFAFSPIITRLYGPEAFGVLGVFTSMVLLITPIAALTYPSAIVLPNSDSDAKGLIRISLTIAGLISIILTIALLLFNEQIVNLFKIGSISHFLYLIPFVILFSAILQVSQQWLIRTKQFRITAKVAFLQALFMNSAKAGIGVFNPIAGVLIVITAMGDALQALMLIINARRSGYKTITDSKETTNIKRLAKTYKDFPLYRAPQVFTFALSQNLPILLLANFFGPASAGFYALGIKVLGIPSSLIGKSVGDVFYPRITDAAKNNENLYKLLNKATLSLITVGIIPFGSVALFGPKLFGFIFGQDWMIAGEYARWVAAFYFFKFINTPSVNAIPVLKLQGGFLIYEIISLVLKLVSLLIGFYLFNNDVYTVALFSISGVIANLYLILWTIKSSKKIHYKKEVK
jgi:O-antigen/teichoic acid export membrane protein